MPHYRLILYRQIETHWHYVRLTVGADALFRTEKGLCGALPDEVSSAPLPAGFDATEALQQAGLFWQGEGYDKPTAKHLQVLTLHFQMPRWKGYAAAAPWYDDWTSGYLDRIEQIFDETCNGILKHNERFSGNHLYYYTVFNPEAAREAVEKIAREAPVQFPLDVHLGAQEKAVKIPIDPNVPDYLRSLFRSFENSARLLARELPVLFPGDPLQPQHIPTQQKRIIGPEGQRLRKVLLEKWNFNSNFWNPLTEDSPEETVFLNGMTDAAKAQVVQLIADHVQQPLYLLDCETGLFAITPDAMFTGAYEGMVFDTTLDWVIYFSHHYTTTFGGPWLVQAIKDIYREEPEALNRW